LATFYGSSYFFNFFTKKLIGLHFGHFFTNSSGNRAQVIYVAAFQVSVILLPVTNIDSEIVLEKQGCQIFLGPNLPKWEKFTK
jgi:hypothetical protein